MDPPRRRAFRLGVAAAWLACAAVAAGSALAGDHAAGDLSPTAVHVDEDGFHSAAADSSCHPRVGERRVIEVVPDVFVAVGFDVANVVLVATEEGNVVIDVGSCDERARETRAALSEFAPGPTRAVVYTHHQIEQTGGGGIWADEPDVTIWASHAMPGEFLRQYMLLDLVELRRGTRQFGLALPEALRLASAMGRCPEPSSLYNVPSIRMPTETVHGEARFELGGIDFHLIEAPGETADHLMVWIPSVALLVVGDNLIRGFPEVHQVRGAAPRQPDAWIATLDRMRALAPRHLVSARHEPIAGREEVARALVDYRDALQWLRNETLRAINRGDSIDRAAETIHLPSHLAESPYLAEETSRVDWAVRAMYISYVGWFDERPEALYPVDRQSAARREIAMMGGPEEVLAAARQARGDGEHRWALHLLAKLRESGLADSQEWDEEYAAALTALSRETRASSGASYLANVAHETLTAAEPPAKWPCPDDATIQQIPLETFFEIMALRLKADRVLKVHESLVVYITDEERQFNLTIRRGIAEINEGKPLPDMPRPVAVMLTDGLTFRKMCMGVLSPIAAMATGKLEIRGNRLAAQRFASRFVCEQKFEYPAVGDLSGQATADER